MTKADPKIIALHKIRSIRKARADLDDQEVQAVAEARTAGATWADIAGELETTQPYAVRKFKPRLEEKRTVTVRESDTAES